MLRRHFTVHLITPASPALVSDEEDAGKEHGCVELGVTEQHLDHAGIGVLLDGNCVKKPIFIMRFSFRCELEKGPNH